MQTQELNLIKSKIKKLAANKEFRAKLVELEKDPDFSALLDIVNDSLDKTNQQLKSLHKRLQKSSIDNEKNTKKLREKYVREFKNLKFSF
jgi:hypothetical protein